MFSQGSSVGLVGTLRGILFRLPTMITEAVLLQCVLTGAGVHPGSYSLESKRAYSGWQKEWDWQVTSCLKTLQTLGMNGRVFSVVLNLRHRSLYILQQFGVNVLWCYMGHSSLLFSRKSFSHFCKLRFAWTSACACVCVCACVRFVTEA